MTLEVPLLFLSEYGVFSSKCNFVLTLFCGEKLSKSRSRLKRRRESVATWRILPTTTKCASIISKILVLHYPQNCDAKSPRDRRADMGFCTKLNYFGASVIFYILKQSTGHAFLPSLPIGKMTLTNVSFMFNGINVRFCTKLR